MKLTAVVISYYPNKQELTQNIINNIKYIDSLIIWNNSPQEDLGEYLKEYANKIYYLGDGTNKGIGYALNKSFTWAIKNGYEYILTMDQDSSWENFRKYRLQITKHLSSIKSKEVAIFAPLVKAQGKISPCNNESFAITSGSVYSLNAFKKIGPFKETFFIDEVDNEYCIRAIKSQYKIKILKDCFLLQTFGLPKSDSRWSKYTQNYSATRTYYQIRNRMWVWRKYSEFLNYKYLFTTLLLQIVRRTFIIVIYEEDKYNKLKAIYKGLLVGEFCKL